MWTFASPARRAPARPNLRVERLEDRTVPAGLLPTDAGFQSLWGLHNTGQTGGKTDADIDAPEAWAVTTGGTGVTVAVIDTGIDYTHPDLYLNVWLNQGEIPENLRSQLQDTDGDGLITFYDLNASANAGIVSDLNNTGYIDAGDLLGRVSATTNITTAWENGLNDDGIPGRVDDLIGWNYVANNNDPYDDNGHGTHVSGTIGATQNAYGVVGVNWRTQIMALKILGPVGSDTLGEVVRDATAAIRDATDNGARVSNNSWVFYDTGTNRVAGETFQGTKYPELYAAIQYAESRGHLVVAAAGNDGYNNDTSAWRNYPASYDLSNIISVAASDKNDRRASFSNYGAKTVDLAAPGGTGGVVPRANDNVWSTVPKALDTDGTPDGYAAYRGTSMAAPHVTGTIALMLSVRPDLSAAQVKELLLESVDPLTDASWVTSTKVQGKTVTEHRLSSGGRLNAYRAVQAALAEPPSDGVVSLSGGTVAAAPTGSSFAGTGGVGTAAFLSAVEATQNDENPATDAPVSSAEPERNPPIPERTWAAPKADGVFYLLPTEALGRAALPPEALVAPRALAPASDRGSPAPASAPDRDVPARDSASYPEGSDGRDRTAGAWGEEWLFPVFVG